jgi:hypothetical protein
MNPSRPRLVDRHETGVVLLVALWTTGFVVRSRLAQSGRLSDIANEALLSLLLMIPIMLVGWGALAIADWRYQLGLFSRRDHGD